MAQQATQTYVELINQANSIFQHSYPGAFTFTAVGMPRRGTVAKTADDLTTWIFVAQTDEGAAELEYENGAFGQPSAITPPVGVEFKPLPQGTILLPAAIDILNQHGYTHGFWSVSLGTPATFQPQPMFWFCVDRQTQGVSASTGEFFPHLFPCNAGALSVPPQ